MAGCPPVRAGPASSLGGRTCGLATLMAWGLAWEVMHVMPSLGLASVPGTEVSLSPLWRVRPWQSEEEADQVRQLVQATQARQGRGFNVEGPLEDDLHLGPSVASGPYAGGEEGALLIAVDAAGLLLGCAAVVVGAAVASLASGRSVSKDATAALRRVCVTGHADVARDRVLESLVASAEDAAVWRGARSILALGYEELAGCQPSSSFLEGRGYRPLGDLEGVADVMQQEKELQAAMGLPSFAGEWRMDLKSSDSLRDVLGALGMNFLLARIIDKLAVTQIITQSAGSLEVQVKTLMGSSTLVLPFNGAITEIPGATGGTNFQSTHWESSYCSNGRGASRLVTRQAVKGELKKDTSLTFETSRSVSEDGVTLWEDVQVLRGSKPVVSAQRVLRRAAEG